ncbi:MAG: putative baseplate assembly protein [Scytonematopsis contorta HA4267-MV1]|jgi:predicted phage baseplate assembly protein|nr:putative baseplate assembly protein [Scytonematopsis contorta HA4267-MV1]
MADTDKELREFKFLPNLPKANLDDRTFDDLLQECILRIPRYCPEWTNHNPSDPGITLVEMFAWLTDQMLYRFNQVPRRYYVAFLELLGIRLQAAVPAQTDVTFYLTAAQSSLKCIPKGTEVATVRTETQQAVVFTTDEDLVIGQPKIKYLLTSLTNSKNKADNFESYYTLNQDGSFRDAYSVYLLERYEVNNCFYLVLEAPSIALSESALTTNNQDTSFEIETLRNSIAGNVIALTFKGTAAAVAGINPDEPPLRWEAWDGSEWVGDILQQKQDDKTKGFSFHQVTQPQQGADIILHLPLSFPAAKFKTYQGHWIRCVYTKPQGLDIYLASPIINNVTVRSIGGAVRASECVTVENELLGISDGKQGQFFQLQGYPVLKRKEEEEYIQVTLPGEKPEVWTEVNDFAASTPRDKHYIIDSRTGEVQFGPLVREPNQLVHQINDRRLRQRGQEAYPSSNSNDDNYLEWQYGEIPTLGAEIRMKSYRFGGGSRGNVSRNQLTVLRTAIPYVKNITNLKEARGGKEAESLDQVVMRVPEILRTSKTAITPEDFENIAKLPSVYNVYCPPCDSPGYVRALIIPDPRESNDLNETNFLQLFPEGINPDEKLKLTSQLKQELEAKFNEHKSLGIKVEIAEPQYVGIKVVAEVLLEDKYQKSQNQNDIKQTIIKKLHYFLNPITGGFEQKGWKIGANIKVAEIIAYLQNMSEIAYVGAIEIFCIRKIAASGEWIVTSNRDKKMIINLNEFEVISSWTDDNPNLNSIITLLNNP